MEDFVFVLPNLEFESQVQVTSSSISLLQQKFEKAQKKKKKSTLKAIKSWFIVYYSDSW